MIKNYCTKQDIENFLGISIDKTFEYQIDLWIEQIEKYIEEETNRVFVADESDSIRYYNGNDIDKIYIDECVSITSVELLDDEGNTEFTLTENVDFYSYPYNRLPIRRLDLRWQSNLGVGYFYRGQRNVKVTANWGYSVDVPSDIRFIATVLVAGIYNYKQGGDGTVASEKTGRYQVTYKTQDQFKSYQRVDGIISRYRKYEL